MNWPDEEEVDWDQSAEVELNSYFQKEAYTRVAIEKASCKIM